MNMRGISINKGNSKDMANLNVPMGHTKGNSGMVRNMERVNFHLRMELDI